MPDKPALDLDEVLQFSKAMLVVGDGLLRYAGEAQQWLIQLCDEVRDLRVRIGERHGATAKEITHLRKQAADYAEALVQIREECIYQQDAPIRQLIRIDEIARAALEE